MTTKLNPRISQVVRRAAQLCLLGLGLIVAGCKPTSSAQASAPIRLATYQWPGSFWIEVATAKGWFREEGLNVERIDVDTKYFESLDLVASGQLDGMGFSQFDLVRHVASGADLVGVAAIDYSEGAEALVAKANIHRLADLKGRKVAVHRGTYLEYLLTVLADREGFSLADIQLVDLTNLAATEAFRTGRVDAAFVWEPYRTESLQVSGAHEIFSTVDFPGLTYSVLTFRRDFVKSRPQDVAALMRVWHRAERFVHENPQETCEIVAKLFDESLQQITNLTHTVHVLDLSDNNRAFSYAAGFESLHASWRRMNDFMLERGLVTQRVDGSSHLDSSFVRALD